MGFKRKGGTIDNRCRAALALMIIGATCCPAVASVGGDLAEINASFTCPQALSSDTERKAAMMSLSRRLAALHLSYAQGQRVLQTMLSVHGCGGTSGGDALQTEQGPPPSAMP